MREGGQSVDEPALEDSEGAIINGLRDVSRVRRQMEWMKVNDPDVLQDVDGNVYVEEKEVRLAAIQTAFENKSSNFILKLR